MNDWVEVDADPSSPSQSKWLIIDESTFVLAQFREVLKSLPIQLLDARDLVHAVETLKIHDDVEIIICDVNLLRMNGSAIFEGLRKNSQTQIPIYLLSAENKVELVAEAQRFGAAGWITKPPVTKDLLAVMQKIKRR